jgi:hypothetical protein
MIIPPYLSKVHHRKTEGRICVICSSEFLARVDCKYKACSRVCGTALRVRNAKRNTVRVSKICEACKKPFTVPKCFEDQRTCSKDCGGVIRRKGLVIRVCGYCSKEFIVEHPSDDKMYCSKECGYASTRGERHHRWNPNKVVVCQNCQKEFRPPELNRKFCSNACNKAWKKIHGNGLAPIGTKSEFGEYIFVKIGRTRWIPEHRMIVEQLLGRPLKKTEIIHHRNGIKHDNRPENLQVVTRQAHMKIHDEAERIGLAIMASNDWVPSVEGMVC